MRCYAEHSARYCYGK